MSQPNRSGLGNGEQSRPSIIKACDMCRRKKIRCDVVLDVCVQCIKHETPCHFTPISTKRAPRRSVKNKRVEELEKRLESTEAELKRVISSQQSGSQPAESINGSAGLGTSSAPNQSEATSPGSSSSSASSSPTSGVSGKKARASDFHISSLSVSSSQEVIAPQAPRFTSNSLNGRAIKALPPKDKFLSLVEQSFQGLYPAFPLFDRAKFMSTFDSSGTNINDLGQWACLNVVLALSPQFLHVTAHDTEEDWETWNYFENAFAVVNQLMAMSATLWSVQALLGMALLTQGTPNQSPVSLLTSAAVKLAQELGLHRKCEDPNISTAEIEERKRVFWIAYILDKDISLQMGQSSTQDDDDMDVELPSEDDGVSIDPGESSVGFLIFRARLAIIQGQIYKRLCSVKATQQSVAERIRVAGELEDTLQSWRASVPAGLIGDPPGPPVQPPIPGLSMNPIVLQLLYFNSLDIIYKSLPATPMYVGPEGTAYAIELQLLSTPLIHVAEARKAIRLVQVTPRRRYACIWAVLHVFVSATKTLLESIIYDPSDPMALSDLALIEPLLTLLDVLAKSYKGRKSKRVIVMHESCMDLFDKAKNAVGGTDILDMDWNQFITSGLSERQESVEEFLQRMNNIDSGYDMGLGSISPGISRDFAFDVEHQLQETLPI